MVGALLGKSSFVKKLNRMDVTPNRSQHQIKNGDILLTYLGMLCMGKPYFEAVHEMDDDKAYYKRQKFLSFTIIAMSFYRRFAAENDGSNQVIVTTFMPLTIILYHR